MDVQIHNISNDGEVFTSHRQSKERVIPEERLKIQYIVANFFIEIANFFKRIFCCEPYELYTVENCRRVTDLTLLPDSGQKDFCDEYHETYKSENEDLDVSQTKSKSDDELKNDSDSNCEKNCSALPVAREYLIGTDVFTRLQSRSMTTDEVSSLFQRIDTQEDAIEFIDLCISRYPLIKEVYAEEHSVREDYLRKLALSAKERERTNSFESEAIIGAFEARKLVYENYLPKNHFTNLVSELVSSFSPALYEKLRLQDLTQLRLTQKKIKKSVEGYEAPHKFDVRLNLLIELGGVFKSREYDFYKDATFFDIQKKKALAYQYYYSKLDSLLVDMKPKLSTIEESLKNDLLEYLISEKGPSICCECVDLQKKVLELFFEYGSVDQLNRFIQSSVFGDFYLCFFNELTDGRQKKLLSLFEIKDTVFDKILIKKLAGLTPYTEFEIGRSHIKKAQNYHTLARIIICNFYEKRPDSELWNQIEGKLESEWLFIRARLAERKILFLITQCLTFLDIEQEEKFSKLSKEIGRCISNYFSEYEKKRIIKNVIKEICNCERYGKGFIEKILKAFAHVFLDNENYCEVFINVIFSSSFGIMWLSGLERIMVKILFQSLLDKNKRWDPSLLRNINSEEQTIAFIDFCLSLPEPLQTVQLHAFKTTRRNFNREVLSKILEDRKIQLVENSVRDWSRSEIYNNAFEMQKVFDDLLAIDLQADMERWVANKKESMRFLKALAAGIEMPDGSIIKCPLDTKDIEQAFQNKELDYKVYAKPIGLYDFLLRED